MDIIEAAYRTGLKQNLENYGIEKTAASAVAEDFLELRKKAAWDDYFYDSNGDFRTSSLLVPLGSMLLAGILGYKSGINGNKDKSAFRNLSNYIIGTIGGLTRNHRHESLYNRQIAENVANGN